MVCFNFLGNAVNHLTYPGSTPSETPPSNKARCQRLLPLKNEFFLTLCRLRCGLMEVDLAYRFHISQTTVSRICIAWINFLHVLQIKRNTHMVITSTSKKPDASTI